MSEVATTAAALTTLAATLRLRAGRIAQAYGRLRRVYDPSPPWPPPCRPPSGCVPATSTPRCASTRRGGGYGAVRGPARSSCWTSRERLRGDPDLERAGD